MWLCFTPPLPSLTPQVSVEGWSLFKRIDLGPLPLSPIDWVEQVRRGGAATYFAPGPHRLPPLQAPDFSHFHELHALPLIPWTSRALPTWVQRMLPVRICHTLSLFWGDSEEWAAESQAFVSPRSGLPLGITGRQYMVFTGGKAGGTSAMGCGVLA